jgi:hypothetical protein
LCTSRALETNTPFFFLVLTEAQNLSWREMTEVANAAVHEVLGQRLADVDEPIVDYFVNVLADEDFDFGVHGDGVFKAIGDLLVDSGCVSDYSECRSVSSLAYIFLVFLFLLTSDLISCTIWNVLIFIGSHRSIITCQLCHANSLSSSANFCPWKYSFMSLMGLKWPLLICLASCSFVLNILLTLIFNITM